MDDVIAAIGPKLRQLRRQKSLSLAQLSDRSGVSAAAIHKIERNGMVPTIATLMKLAQALNRPVAFFVDEEPAEPAVLTPARARKEVFTSKKGLELEGVSGPYGRFLLAGAMATIQPHANSGARAMEHPGEELILVLEGSLHFDVDGEVYELKRGDALHFRTDRPHRWRNPRATRTRAAWMALRQP